MSTTTVPACDLRPGDVVLTLHLGDRAIARMGQESIYTAWRTVNDVRSVAVGRVVAVDFTDGTTGLAQPGDLWTVREPVTPREDEPAAAGSKADVLLAQLREHLTAVETYAGQDDAEAATSHAVDAASAFRRLDAHLSSGGTPPTAWSEGPDEPYVDSDPPQLAGSPRVWGWQGDARTELDEDDPRHRDDERPVPEGLAVFAHWSASHDGINVQIDAPDDVRLSVWINEWRATDLIVGDVQVPEPAISLPLTEDEPDSYYESADRKHGYTV